MINAQGFVDVGYICRVAARLELGQYPDPRQLVARIARTELVEQWAGGTPTEPSIRVCRVRVYDAQHEEAASRDSTRDDYLNAVELLPDTHLGFGVVRGEGKKFRQKGVDTLIAVDMLVGAFTRLYDVAILVAGDADFVPVVAELQRRGAMVVVSGHIDSVADDLRRAADRFVHIIREKQDSPARDCVYLPHMTPGAFPLS